MFRLGLVHFKPEQLIVLLKNDKQLVNFLVTEFPRLYLKSNT